MSTLIDILVLHELKNDVILNSGENKAWQVYNRSRKGLLSFTLGCSQVSV